MINFVQFAYELESISDKKILVSYLTIGLRNTFQVRGPSYFMEFTQDYLKSIIDYSPETGLLKWKFRPDVSGNVNARFAGKQIGALSENGYLLMGINGKTYLVHRIAYFIYYGSLPALIDHDNHIKTDNRVINLKPSDKAGNGKNANLSKRNKSGFTGVNYFKRDQKWQANIYHNGKTVHLGYFDLIEDACKARKLAENKFGYHKNHGLKAAS